MACSGRRFLASMARASDRRDPIDTLSRDHVRIEHIKGGHLAHSPEANVAHSTQKSTRSIG